MPLGIELARIRLPWAFTGWHAAAEAIRPNFSPTAPLCIHVATIGNGPDVNALREDIIRWAELLGWQRINLPPRTVPPGPEDARIRNALGLPAGNLSELPWDRLASKVWKHGRPPLLVDPQASPTSTLGAAVRAFVADLDSRRGDARMQQVGVVTCQAEPGACIVHLDAGMPAVAPDQVLIGPIDEAWRAYLHHRIAWEAAGDPEDARRIDPTIQRIKLGQEASLESSFKDAAKSRWQRLDRALPEVNTDIARWLSNPRAVASTPELSALTWRPCSGVQILRPWVARALLAGSPDAPPWMRAAWRHAIVPQPLVGSLLSASFLIEHQQRAQCMSDHSRWRPMADDLVDARKIADRFSHGGDLASTLYPPGAVWVPDPRREVESWLTYGEVRRISLNDFSDDVANLRNALAHGHPPTWPAVMILRKVMTIAGNPA